MEPGLVVGAILVDDLVDPSRLLAARRSEPAGLGGRWEFPGGKVEVGETPAQALLRELTEELSITAELGAELTRPGGGAWTISPQWTLRLWFALPIGEPTPGVAHDELRWLTVQELGDVDWLDTDREVVALLAARPPRGPLTHLVQGG